MVRALPLYCTVGLSERCSGEIDLRPPAGKAGRSHHLGNSVTTTAEKGEGPAFIVSTISARNHNNKVRDQGLLVESCALGAYPNLPKKFTTHARIATFAKKVASGLSNPQNLLV